MRAYLLGAIFFASVFLGSLIIYDHWQALPIKPAHHADAIGDLLKSRPNKEMSEIASVLAAAQGSRLSRDDSVAKLELNSPLAKKIRNGFTQALNIDRQLQNIPSVSAKINQIFAEDANLTTLALSKDDLVTFLRDNPDDENAKRARQALSELGGSPNDKTIEQMTIRRGLLMTLNSQAQQLFSEGRYEACIKLCEASIKALRKNAMPDAVNSLRELMFRSREARAWNTIESIRLGLKDSMFEKADFKLLKQYLNDFDSKQQKQNEKYLKFYADHVQQALRLYDWNELINEERLRPLLNRQTDLQAADIARVKPSVLAIRDFYNKYKSSTEGERAKELATDLLHQHVTQAMAPREIDEQRVKFTLSRSGKNYEGIIESHDLEEHVTILAPQTTPRKLNRSYFFASALENPPVPINDPAIEARYRDLFETDVATLTDFDWDPESLELLKPNKAEAFPGIPILRKPRSDHAARIRELIKMCETFQEPDGRE